MSTGAWRQIALGEEAAVYAYGVLAAAFPVGAERNRAIDLSVAHARARDRARAQLAAEDVDPDAPGAFEIPFPVDGVTAARRLAALVESRLVDVYATQLAEFTGKARRNISAHANEAATRAVTWGARTTAFPGGQDSDDDTLPAASTSGSPAPTSAAPASPEQSAPANPQMQTDGASLTPG